MTTGQSAGSKDKVHVVTVGSGVLDTETSWWESGIQQENGQQRAMTCDKIWVVRGAAPI